MTTAPPSLTETADSQLRRIIDGPPSPERLNAALRLLAKWRATVIGQVLARRLGPQVQNGPLAGLRYGVEAAEGSYPARLLGAYEATLFPVIETIIARAYPLVIDVGCAEGYYAVGLARRMPGSTVWARDASERAQALCRDLAAQNGVADRVQVGGLLTHADLGICTAQPTAIICDIEGAEEDLLDPRAAPGLRAADILVEVHEGMKPGLLAQLRARFEDTHRITTLGRALDSSALPAFAEAWSDMDRLLALWEWRAGPTPWLWMEARHRP